VTTQPDDGQWSMPAKDYASTRFSALEEINSTNVANLKLAWTFSTGVLRGHEAAPIAANNTMYIITPYPNKPMAKTAPDDIWAVGSFLFYLMRRNTNTNCSGRPAKLSN
jgi:glucose dehydrogenase